MAEEEKEKKVCKPIRDPVGTGCPNDSKMTLHTKRSKVPHIHVTSTPRVPNFTPFRSTTWPAVFELQAILRQGLRMTPKWPCTLKCQRYTIYWVTILGTYIVKYLENDKCTKSHLAHLVRPAIFELREILRQVHRMTPKWACTLKDQKYPIYKLQLSASHKFHLIFLYGQSFLHYSPFWDKCTRWPPNDREH